MPVTRDIEFGTRGFGVRCGGFCYSGASAQEENWNIAKAKAPAQGLEEIYADSGPVLRVSAERAEGIEGITDLIVKPGLRY